MAEVQVSATTLSGDETVERYPVDAKVSGLKAKIAAWLDTDKILTSLVFDSDLLDDELTLEEQGISTDCSITVISKDPPELSDYEQRYQFWCATNRIANQIPIHEAAGTNNTDALSAEIEKGVDPSITGSDFETPLHHASRLGCLDTAMLLVESGAAVDARNSYGNTVLQYACFRHPTDETNHGGVNKDEVACMLNRSAMLILMVLAGANVETGGDGGCTAHHRLGRKDTGATLVLKNKEAIYANGLGSKDKLAELLEQVPELCAVRASFVLLLELRDGTGYGWAARMVARRSQ